MYRVVALILVAVASLQLLGISDFVGRAIWQWYKFLGFGNSGYVTISLKMAAFTFVASVVGIIVSCVLFSQSTDRFANLTAKYSGFSFVLGLLAFSFLLITPIGHLVNR